MDDLTPLADELYAKLELIITPTSPGVTLNDVLLTLVQFNFDGDCFKRNDQIIARFKRESQMQEILQKCNEPEQSLGFVAAPVRPATVEPIQTDVKILESFPVDELASFMAKYDANYNAQPFQPLQPAVTLRKKVIKCREGSRLLKTKMKVYKCNECHASCTYKCSRTERPFCSRECQAKHDNIDLPASGLKDPESLSGQKFVIIGFESAHTVFIRSERDTERFIEFMNEVALMAKRSGRMGRCTVDRPVLANYKDQWYRAVVTAVLSNTVVRLRLPDLGLEQVFLVRQLKMPDAEFDEPVTLLKCKLVGVERDGISFECEKLFEKLQAEDATFLALSDDPDAMVLRVSGGRNLKDLVNDAMTMTVGMEETSYYLKDLPINEYLLDQENVPMLITDFSDIDCGLSLAHGEYFKKCYRYETHFQEFPGKVQGNYTPCNKEVCLVKMRSTDGKTFRWLRAFGLLNCGDEHPRMELLDYGSVVKVHISCIRKIPKQLLYPAATLIYTPGAGTDLDNSYMEMMLKAQNMEGACPVVISRIQPADKDHNTDRFHCPNLGVQLQSAC